MIELCEAGYEDAAAMAELHRQCFAEVWTEAAFGQFFNSPGVFGLFASDKAKRVGFVLARTAADEAEILSLAVLKAARRRGIACLMLEAAALRAQRLGANALFLEVDTENNPAWVLYRRLGFREVGRRPGYYRSGTGEGITLRTELPLAVLGNAGEVD